MDSGICLGAQSNDIFKKTDGVTENQDLYPRNESLWKNSDSAKVSTSSQNIHSTIKKETRNEDVIFTSNVVKERWGRAIQKVICL
ncbi:hypothetical protein XELAEV_18020645mg [Xenopus laevis]|uniref:Uncharacterized protein n=1 Tax=Xenopus laevis TaxID=8355 RepID=A0A974DA02_XENLA|nr:hypothetical protein XELAEV_18020645mg [Xenopus laevis]